MFSRMIQPRTISPASNGHRRSGRFGSVLLYCLAWAPAGECLASFHFMQIEKVVGGVNGDTTAQAIQLRMRAAAQEQVNRGKILAFDASGENPIVLIDFDETVRSNSGGDRLLIATMAMRAYTQPASGETFLMDRPIPESYLAAGSIVFVNDEETLVVWRFSWGGEAYTGETMGALTNDDDREFGPAFPGPLPFEGLRVIEFVNDFTAKSTSNAADYRLSEEPGVLTNNSDVEMILIVPDCSDPAGAGPDSDADGLRDVCDECPDDSGKWEPGLCGCGVADTDSDFDGIPNCFEGGNGNTNGNANENENENQNGNENGNDNTGGNENGNVNENDNSGNDNEPTGNGNDNTGGNDNSAGNGNDNGSGGGSGRPRGCTPSLGVLMACLIGLCGLRVTQTRK